MPRPLLDKLEDWVSVKDYGAVGDGATDDTAAVQAAVTACSSAALGGARLLYFPARGLPGLERAAIGLHLLDGLADRQRPARQGVRELRLPGGGRQLGLGAAAADLPFSIADMIFDAAAAKTYGFVWRSTQGSSFSGATFYGANDTNLLISSPAAVGTANASMNNGKIVGCSFGQTDLAAGLTVFSQYSVRTVGAAISDFFIRGNFFGGSTTAPFETFNLYLYNSVGFVITDNHFYGSCERSNDSTCGSLYLAGSDFATVVANNIIEDSVVIANGSGSTSYGTVFGPNNIMLGGQLFCLFGAAQNLIKSFGNHYTTGATARAATIQHLYNASSRVVLSSDDYFEVANPFTWLTGNTLGVYSVTDSYTFDFGAPRFLTGTGPYGTTFGASSLYAAVPSFANGLTASSVGCTGEVSASTGVFSGYAQALHTLGSSGLPTVVAGAGAGTSPIVSISTGSVDEGGQLVVFTGSAPSAGAVVATVTFATAFPSYAWTVLSPQNPQARESTAYVSGCSNVGFVVSCDTVALGGPGVTYVWTWGTKGK